MTGPADAPWRTLHVLLLTPLYPPVAGGAETYANSVATGLIRRGHRVTVLTDAVDGARERPEHVRSLSSYRNRLQDPQLARWEQLIFGLLPEMSAAVSVVGRPDVVMVNSLDTAVWGRVIASALSIPLVLTSHEHAPEDEEFGAGRAALGYYYLAPELIIAGSEFYWSRAVRYAREGTVVLLHHGVDTDSLRRRPDRRAATRAALGVTDDQIVVVCPGRFKHRKNQQLLLRAVARLTRPVREQVTVVFLGSVSSASNAYLRGMMSLSGNLGLSDRVIIRTDVAQSGMLDFYDAADVTAVPSLEEGLGYVVLEAMAAGCPVITSPVPGIREILELDHSCAAIADVDDEASWSRTLTSLVEDAAQRAAFGGAGHRLVLENFSEDVMIDALESKLFALTDGPPTNAPADATLRVNPGAYRAGPIVKAGRTDD